MIYLLDCMFVQFLLLGVHFYAFITYQILKVQDFMVEWVLLIVQILFQWLIVVDDCVVTSVIVIFSCLCFFHSMIFFGPALGIRDE